MTQQEYEQKKQECWEEFCRMNPSHNKSIFAKKTLEFGFGRAYALGKQKETITQEEIEKAAEKFADDVKIPASFPGVMVYFINGLAHDSYLQGAQDFLGKQEKDADTVIQGWVARDKGRFLGLYPWQPKRGDVAWLCGSCMVLLINTFPDLTWDDDPEPVEIIIKRKKNG